MAVTRKPAESSSTPRRRPATTPEGRENQLIALATDLAERQLADGTASAQVVTHYLKLGTTREQLEQERLRHENELLKARTQQIADGGKIQELFQNALDAFRGYSPQQDEEDYAD